MLPPISETLIFSASPTGEIIYWIDIVGRRDGMDINKALVDAGYDVIAHPNG